MPETLEFKYRAFISYSHADTSWAKWLHRALEAFRIDKDLAGRETSTGTILKTLRPIFRDRDDFTAGDSLTDQTRAALDASAALIVLCSPRAAKSDYVAQEIRLFKSRHPDRPVIPLIVDGTPGDTEQECFPRSLAFKLDDAGQITDDRIELLAADAREEADGKSLALAKIVAGLLGVSSDEIFRRAERERRRKGRIRNGIAAGFAALLIGGGFFAWQAHERQQTLVEVEALVARYSAAGAEAASPGAEQSLMEAITSIAQGATRDPRYAQALELLKAGKPEEAEPLLAAVAEDKKKLAAKQNQEAAEAYRNLAAIAEISSPWKARGYYAEAAALDPGHVEGMFKHGWFQKKAGALHDAETAFRRVIPTAKTGNEKWIYWSRLGIGDIHVARGDLLAAITEYRAARKIAERRAETDPDNAGWQHDLAVSYNKVGNVAKAQGDLESARQAYSDGLGIAMRLAAVDPDNAGWQRELSVSYNKVGNVAKAQGELELALKAYSDALAIRMRLAESDPDNAGWQRDLAASYDKVGDVAKAQGDLAGARQAYSDGLGIAMRLAETDPDNAGWQRDLSVSYNKVGDVLFVQGDLERTLEAYSDALVIRMRLAERDPDNAGRQRSLSVSYDKVGDVAKAKGDLKRALKAYSDSLGLAERLARTDPGNAGWQRDLSVSYNKVGGVLLAQGDSAAALKSYSDGMNIIKRLVVADPANAGWQRDLLVSYERLGNAAKANGDLASAHKAYTDALSIAERLAEADPGNAGWQRTLSVSHEKVGDVAKAKGDLPAALRADEDSLRIRERLAQAYPGNARWQRDLASSHGRIAAVLAQSGEISKARESYQQARAITLKLIETSPGNATLPKDVAWYESRIAALDNAEASELNPAQDEAGSPERVRQ